MQLEWINRVQPEQTENRGRRLKVDSQIKICNTCNRSWEFTRNHPAGFTIYPEGMIPTYGKKKEICPVCTREQENK
tara:strand:+ start:728 stop:955 length:228 start_codon:yes stop_codon:yes gene_type:complete